MTPWIYDDTPDPVAKWGRANGEPSVMLDMPDGGDTSDQGVAGTDDFDGPSVVFQGDKALAIAWLVKAYDSVALLPDTPTWPDGEVMKP